LLVAYVHLDEVIRIIREEDLPKEKLMATFGLSDEQATAILDLRLRQLAKLEEAKLNEEKDELTAEAEDLESTLGSEARLKALVKEEIAADAETYGDARRTEIAVADEARAFTERDLLSSEPITVILSEKGWGRAAKGHDIDPAELSYRTGDAFAAAGRGKTSDACVFFDSTGRAYTVPPHTLPSARGQGEPLTGRLKVPDGAHFVSLAIGDGGKRLLLASDTGYGFVTTLAETLSKNRAGKAVLNVGKDATPLPPAAFDDAESLAVATNRGYLIVIPLADVPELARGKGQKLIGIPAKALREEGERVIAIAVLAKRDRLIVRAGARHLNLRGKDLDGYRGDRAHRGRKLPRGFQRVDGLETG
jgi:topoisomerase-4 subunit A